MSPPRLRPRRLVLDASVLLKGYFREDGHSEARRLLAGRWTFLAPDLILPEAGNAVWKKLRRGELTAPAALRTIRALRRAPVRVEPSAPLLTRAFAIASENGRGAFSREGREGVSSSRATVYDSLYVALAVRHACPVVTADERLFNALRGGDLGPHVRWFADPALLVLSAP